MERHHLPTHCVAGICDLVASGDVWQEEKIKTAGRDASDPIRKTAGRDASDPIGKTAGRDASDPIGKTAGK
jgi:hypothetical protein